MVLTKDELKLIEQAEHAMAQSKIAIAILFAMQLVFVAGLFLELVAPTMAAVLCVASTLYALFLPRVSGPNYTKMVALLTKVRAEARVEEPDPIIEALKSK